MDVVIGDAAAVAKALRGHRVADGWLCRCPVPSHGKGKGDRRPSLWLHDGDTALLVRCFAACSATDILTALRSRGLINEAGERRAAPRRREPLRPEPESEPDQSALELWKSAQTISGDDVAGRYLRGRGLVGPFPPTLRFAKGVVYPHAAFPFPAMVAAVQRPDRRIISVQLTFLRVSDAIKAPLAVPRLTVGRLGAGAVRLAAAGEVLGLAEGVETALAAMELSSVPCWATLGGHRLGKVTLPDRVREVHVFSDNDEAGRLAGVTAADHYASLGRKVVLRCPPDGFGDWNDVVKAQIGRVAA